MFRRLLLATVLCAAGFTSAFAGVSGAGAPIPGYLDSAGVFHAVAQATPLPTRPTENTNTFATNGGYALTQHWFLSGQVAQVAVTSDFSVVQIFNPANSGVTCIIAFASAKAGASEDAVLAFHNTARTTLIGTAANAYDGGSASACKIYTDAIASGQATGQAILNDVGISTGNGTATVINGAVAVVLPPGNGVEIEGLTAFTSLTAYFDWFEIPTANLPNY